MTLLDMIKKYEKVRTELEKKRLEYPPDHLSAQIETMECIIEDLRSIAARPCSIESVQRGVLKMIDEATVEHDPDGALAWARTLQILQN